MLGSLRKRENANTPILVGLIGAGAMGRGIALQVARTPGMTLAFIADSQLGAAEEANRLAGSNAPVTDDAMRALEIETYDILVESTNSITPAARYAALAIDHSAHVVLMNAEVDLAYGVDLHRLADRRGVVVTSDAGDQHGVLATMMEEIELWGFRIVQAGNIKGFLNRYAKATDLIEEAAKRQLAPIQCCAYTDGTKLNVEMSVIANGKGLLPVQPGMSGPQCDDVKEVLDRFDFNSQGAQGTVDYILGAEPGGGVYVVGHCDDPIQAEYLRYYKMEEGPYYLFYRPYHLCHLETVRAIGRAVLYQEPILQPRHGRLTDVYAYAKCDLKAGIEIDHAIGGDYCYGLIEVAAEADSVQKVPITQLEPMDGMACKLTRAVGKDEPLTLNHVTLPNRASL